MPTKIQIPIGTGAPTNDSAAITTVVSVGPKRKRFDNTHNDTASTNKTNENEDTKRNDNDVEVGSPPAKRATKKKYCKSEGCNKWPKKGGVCIKQRKICKHDGCSNIAMRVGLCRRHGIKKKSKICKHGGWGCSSEAQKRGLCKKHLAEIVCNIEFISYSEEEEKARESVVSEIAQSVDVVLYLTNDYNLSSIMRRHGCKTGKLVGTHVFRLSQKEIREEVQRLRRRNRKLAIKAKRKECNNTF